MKNNYFFFNFSDLKRFRVRVIAIGLPYTNIRFLKQLVSFSKDLVIVSPGGRRMGRKVRQIQNAVCSKIPACKLTKFLDWQVLICHNNFYNFAPTNRKMVMPFLYKMFSYPKNTGRSGNSVYTLGKGGKIWGCFISPNLFLNR